MASETRHVKVLVIGAGPTGLGAASRLMMHGEDSWLLVDENAGAGGLACTQSTPEGFIFDMGGHVIFSHYLYFDQLIDAGKAGQREPWCHHERVSHVWVRNRFVAYPFQNNIVALPEAERLACLDGLVRARIAAATRSDKPRTFDEWITRYLGEGIADVFMRPYNFKVWATRTTDMQCAWLGERVANPDLQRIIRNVVMGTEDPGWGPNAVFRFPASRGTGGIWEDVAALLPPSHMKFGSKGAVDADAHLATFSCGLRVRYDNLLSTIPLDVLLGMVGQPQRAVGLRYASSHIIGVGVRGVSGTGKKCWLYFPEDDCPFYRCTIFSHYAPGNTPPEGTLLPTLCTPAAASAGTARAAAAAEAGPYWSLMFEVSESDEKPVDSRPVSIGDREVPAVVLDTIRGAVSTRLLQANSEIVSLFHCRLERGYPVPSLSRDAALANALPYLQERGIWSRGRFGAWKYEVANQDHSCMQGVEAVDNILLGTTECTLLYPDLVNSRGLFKDTQFKPRH